VKVYPFIRSILFRLDPERAHRLTLSAIQLAGEIGPVRELLNQAFAAPMMPVQAFGLNFPNPIGLAAGYDKDGLGWRGLASLGFGHIEIGTVTPKPQLGNPKPRLFRIPEEKALINRLGFPGKGAEFVMQQISKPRPKQLVLGVNIGKNKDTPLESAVDDYLYLLRMFAEQADYLTINVSSPNTVGLRQLQEREALDHLLRQINSDREIIAHTSTHPIPVLVKLSPDLTDEQLDEALEVIVDHRMDGVIATNTTVSREGMRSSMGQEAGGLSGRPLFERSLAMVKKIYLHTSGKLPIIGVGGISNANGVQKMMDAGAVLVQLYTGLLYEGPQVVKQILREMKP
jgi:dihydroorotate dehydrogenase